MIFGSVKEEILEILDERLGAFQAKVMAIVGVCTLSFCDFRACRALTFHGEWDPIPSSRWLADMANTFRTSFYIEEVRVIYASCLLKDMGRDWWEEVGHEVRDDVVDSI